MFLNSEFEINNLNSNSGKSKKSVFNKKNSNKQFCSNCSSWNNIEKINGDNLDLDNILVSNETDIPTSLESSITCTDSLVISTNANSLAPDPKCISLVSKEMTRLCCILNEIYRYNSEWNITEEYYRWHWFYLLKCKSVEQFSPYQVIFSPYKAGSNDISIIESISKDLIAFYNLSNNGTLNSTTSNSKKSDLVTPIFAENTLTDTTPVAQITQKRAGYRKKSESVAPDAYNTKSITQEIRALSENLSLKNSTNNNTEKPFVNNSTSPKINNKGGRKSATKESAARILQMCLAEGGENDEELLISDNTLNNDIITSEDIRDSSNEQCSLVEDSRFIKEEKAKLQSESKSSEIVNLSLGVIESDLEDIEQNSTFENGTSLQTGSSNQEHTASIALGKLFSYKLVAKLRRKIPRYLYVKWARERTRVGGSFVVSRGRGYDFRFPPRDLTISAFQAAFKGAVRKRIELYGPITFPPQALPLCDEDFVLDEFQVTELESIVAEQFPNFNIHEANTPSKRQCIQSDQGDEQQPSDLSRQVLDMESPLTYDNQTFVHNEINSGFDNSSDMINYRDEGEISQHSQLINYYTEGSDLIGETDEDIIEGEETVKVCNINLREKCKDNQLIGKQYIYSHYDT
ncbi:hypothetical protein cand_006740 [Cryptosporidium andersoni]|uniref:Uncharacterized protein n=1 Tax=Cryptosporidium andersoni TaxID=117008 RepID=A0A1J4MTD4_9CRYT|nr:hypothetical protein cand_006740 [Cryptosporidium andersoni]